MNVYYCLTALGAPLSQTNSIGSLTLTADDLSVIMSQYIATIRQNDQMISTVAKKNSVVKSDLLGILAVFMQ
jgi:hypothetical protein